MTVEPPAVADAFGLGRLVDAPAALAGGGTAQRWRLRTDRGVWMVKTCMRPAAWEREQMRDAGALERAAYAAGVAMPRPVDGPLAPARPTDPAPAGPTAPARPLSGSAASAASGRAIGLWRPVGPGYARVAEWVDGAPPATNTVPLARWLGRTLATLDRLGLPADPATGVAYALHPMSDWRQWIDDARAADLLDRREAADAEAAVADLTALVSAGLASGPTFQLGHRDANPRNILVTDRGAVLIDFDSAGPEVPWWGAVYHAWDFARDDLPMLGPAVLDAYAGHGGRLGPADATAFAGLARGILDGFAFHLRVVTGRHPVDQGRRTAAVRNLRLYAQGVPEIPALIDSWVPLLRGSGVRP